MKQWVKDLGFKTRKELADYFVEQLEANEKDLDLSEGSGMSFTCDVFGIEVEEGFDLLCESGAS